MTLVESSFCAMAVIFTIIALGAIFGTHVAAATTPSLRILVVVGFGVAALAAIGLVVALLPLDKRATSATVLGATLLIGGTYRLWRESEWLLRELRAAAPAIAAWVALSLVALWITYLPAKRPPVLYDGPYVFKTWYLPVQIQALTGNLPADNALPAVVAEYLLQGVPFREERPVMPGQEVSNRPILMSLAAVPLRALLGPVAQYASPLPRFKYVGKEWPDTMSLVTELTFRQFLVTGIVLNASIALGFLVLLRLWGVYNRGLAAMCFLLVSPYVLLHVVFTWPKNLAAFFVLTSIMLLRWGGDKAYWVAGASMGLAFWAHPFALSFLVVAIGVLALFANNRHLPWTQLASFATAALIVVLPWIVWTKLYLDIPSDLIAQNLNRRAPIAQQIWVRIHNLYELLFPTAFSVHPFSAAAFITTFLKNLAAPLGLLLLPLLVPVLTKGFRSDKATVLTLALLPGLMIVGVFGAPAVPLLHGWQAVWPVLCVAGLATVQEIGERKPWLIRVVIGAQMMLNVALLLVWWRAFVSTESLM